MRISHQIGSALGCGDGGEEISYEASVVLSSRLHVKRIITTSTILSSTAAQQFYAVML
jgi:hypothetical protein